MKIDIYKPLCLNEKGKRDNNEDSIFPAIINAEENNSLFIVCDGVGGAEKGEIASDLACTAFAGFFADNNIVVSAKQEILDAFMYVQTKFDKYFEDTPAAKGMGTTLVLFHLHNNGVTVAHCGDSRFYHIRANKILYKTTDHTPINDLLKLGIITPEEAEQSPKSSRISRAIQGNSVQRTKPDVFCFNDILINDYLLICSDGVHGCITDNDMLEILTAKQNDSEKIETIKTLCEANSNDNFSLILVRIKNISTQKTAKNLLGLLKNVFAK